MTTRLLAGARPTGGMHIGHLYGFIRPYVETVPTVDESLFVVADLHMFTTNPNRKSTDDIHRRRDILIDQCIAAGMEHPVQFYVQSDCLEQAQIYAIVQSLIPHAPLAREESYLDMARNVEAASLGLLGYPVLEAADVIALQATHVAVGQFNVSHVTAGQDAYARLREEWGIEFPHQVPLPTGANMIGLDGKAKMSKSLGNSIELSATTAEVEEKIAGMAIWGDGGICVPAEILGYIRGADAADALRDRLNSGQASEGDARAELTDAVETVLTPIRRRFYELQMDPGHSKALLERGAARAREIAADTLDRLKTTLSMGS